MSEFATSRSGGHHESEAHSSHAPTPGKQTLTSFAAPVQLNHSDPDASPSPEESAAKADVRALAGKGTATVATSLPHFDTVQAAFGHHDISGLVAHTGEEAGATAAGMGAKGYTAGRHVVLGPGADLFTVAHEAAHFIEQQHGLVNLAGGVGAVGDVYEQHANAVAAQVVAGQSAEGLLDQYVGGASKRGAVESGPVQQQPTELAQAQTNARPAKIENAQQFERRLGVAAFQHPGANAAASAMIERIAKAVIQGIDADNPSAEHQAAYADLFGKANLGDDNEDRANGAWSAGQVGKDFEVLFAAMQNGNLREKMTGVYNAALGGFKHEVKELMGGDRAAMTDRGLDANKLSRRNRQMSMRRPIGAVASGLHITNKLRPDVYRDPGNPIDRKKYSTFEMSSDSRVANPEEERQTKRTVGELDAEGIGLSQREKDFQYGKDADPSDDTALKWKEGGTWYSPNDNSKWVQKYRDKLLMPVTAGPSGTALRLFQAWEFLGKPSDIPASHLRLALLGWMLTGNDHSFHEIMATSAIYGLPYTPGVDAYRQVDPFTADELATIAGPDGFPDQHNYNADHLLAPEPSDKDKRAKDYKDRDPRIGTGEQTSIFSRPGQIKKLNELVQPGEDFANTERGELGQVMALLIYTDDRNKPGGHSAFEFINNVLKGKDNWLTMQYYLRKDARLKQAYDENKFNIKELILEAKQHAKYAVEGMQKLPAFQGDVFRGYKVNRLPSVGDTESDTKFVSMSTNEDLAKNYAVHPTNRGRYQVLAVMQSKSGRQIGAASMFGREGEILFAPGTQFRVTTAPVRESHGSQEIYRVTWEEVSSPVSNEGSETEQADDAQSTT